MAETPVKTITRVQLTPTSKQFMCIICGENIQNKHYRIKLFMKEAKTSHCLLMERLLQIHILPSGSTDHACRRCMRNLSSIENKISRLKEQYSITLERLKSSHGKKSRKRLIKEPEQGSKKPSFVLQECTSQMENVPTTWNENESLQNQQTVISYTMSPGYKINEGLIMFLSRNDYQSAVHVMLKNSETRQMIFTDLVNETKRDLRKLCKKDSLSILRGQNKEKLEQFTITAASEEIRQNVSFVWNFLSECILDPKQDGNKIKKGGALLPQLVSTVASLIYLFNRDMNAFQCINSLIMLKGSCKKSSFARLNGTGLCLSYRGTLDMADKLSMGWEKELAEWKMDVENSLSIEEVIEKQIANIDDMIVLMSGSTACEALVMEQDQLKQSLYDHRKVMHPGYYFVGDNVDLRTQVRQMTAKNQAKDFHMYNTCAYMNRVSGNNFDNTKQKGDVKSVLFSELIPNEELNRKMVENFTFLVAHEWCDRIVWLRPFKKALPTYIQHPHMKEMKQKTRRVNMGVLMKNEQFNDQMVDICQFLHKYVPGHDENEESGREAPQKVLSGGDYLTFERHKSAQSSMANSRTPSRRLEGLIPKMEEFHNQAELLKVIWKALYSTKSSKDVGTLYAARNIINARNVTDEPGANFYASSELMNKFDAANIICGGLKHFGMISIEADPILNVYSGKIGDETEMRDFVFSQAKHFIQEHLAFELPSIPEYGLQSNVLHCRICNKEYRKTKKLRKHEACVHASCRTKGYERFTYLTLG